jgi:glycerophosphoryl diester phosphodiesterase
MLGRFARGERARPWVYGHRGTRRGAPENTLPAMQLAIAQGAEGIELDVRLCGSGEVIVLHDPDLARVAGVALRAADSSYAALAAHDLGAGARVPLLDEALSLVLGAGLRLNVELKADVPDIDALVAAVLRCVRARPAHELERVLFSSFDAEVCSELHSLAPELPVGFLCEHVLERGPPGMAAVHAPHALLTQAATEQLHAAGLLVNTWTVNDPGRARKLASFGVDGIITDDVPAVLAVLAVLSATGD